MLQLKQIVYQASRLRQENPSLYGIKNASPGTRGHVHDGWKRAVQEATKLYYDQTGKQPQKRIGTTISQQLKNDERQLALYHGYRIKLEQLKTKYWNAGLKIKAVQPVKQREKREGYARKRLLPVILTGSMQSTPSIQLIKRDQVKGLKLSDNMDTVEEVKQGKKRPNFMEPEVTPTLRKLHPLLYRQEGRPTLIKKMEYAPSFSFDSPKRLKQSHYLNEEDLSALEDYINENKE